MIIKNGEVFQEDGSFQIQDLYVENHKIVATEAEVTDKTVIDAKGLKVLPGLVDVHSHGAFGHDFSDADPEGLKIILKYEKSHGVTSYCPTSMTLSISRLPPAPEADLPNLWNKFYKVDKARTREYGGSGIGLSIVKAILEGMNQEYGVQNFDNGVEFWFTLDRK